MHGIVGVTNAGAHTDSIRLIPGSTAAVQFVPDNVGTWLLHCHINDHIHAGMQALFTVHPAIRPVPHDSFEGARQRVYYIQAEDQLWDYAPLARNVCDDSEFGDDQRIFTQPHLPIDLDDAHNGTTGYTIGSKYLKTRYVQYTDQTFTVKVERRSSMAHLGLMGPVIRARVGEVIIVHLRNRASLTVSMHPHGVLYTKGNEGSPYNDGTSRLDKIDDFVHPGRNFTYRWEVPARAGPGPGEQPDVKLWMYHSHSNEIADTYTGLFGPIIIISKDARYDDDTLLPLDGTREVFLHMSVMDEGNSFHVRLNARQDRANKKLNEQKLEQLLEHEVFQESNLMHSINGYLYCNGPVVNLKKDHPTQFYFYSLGTEGEFLVH